MKRRKKDETAAGLVYSVEEEGEQRVVQAHMRFPPDYFTPIFKYARAFAEVHEIADAPIRVVIEEADASSAKWLETIVIGERLKGNDVQGICKKVYATDEFTAIVAPKRTSLCSSSEYYLRRAA